MRMIMPMVAIINKIRIRIKVQARIKTIRKTTNKSCPRVIILIRRKFPI